VCCQVEKEIANRRLENEAANRRLENEIANRRLENEIATRFNKLKNDITTNIL
jgi:hypothetical protein